MGVCFDEVEKNMNFCFLYPGQGSQKVGMADFLLSDKEAIDLIIEADDILDSNLSKLIFEGCGRGLNTIFGGFWLPLQHWMSDFGGPFSHRAIPRSPT